MADQERKVLLERGFHVRIYVPMGEMLPGMSYLVRRLLENTSQMGFLRLRHQDAKGHKTLLAKPKLETTNKIIDHQEFINHPMADFSNDSQCEKMSSALAVLEKEFPFDVSAHINGQKIISQKSFEKKCPSDSKLILAKIHAANIDQAQLAVDSCHNSFEKFKNLSISERAQHLENLASILERDQDRLAALICYEVGKSWFESYSDVAEAIDFCRYYKDCSLKDLVTKKVGELDGENNTLSNQGRGTSVIIAPWNFPLAILTGMSVAAYVCGNPIVLKPAEQSSITAYFLYQAMMEASFVSDCVQFLPGLGEEIGPYLVAHKNVANICFTGSKVVGHQIIKTANTIVEGQLQMKRVVCEMGGKNAIIVDDDADLDEAIHGILASAFNYAGQKCSAASKLIVHQSIKDNFLNRLIEASKSLLMGSSIDPSTDIGPVIDEEAQKRLLQKIAILQDDKNIRIHYMSERPESGSFVPIVLVEVFDKEHWLLKEELFGPIIAIYFAADLEQAIFLANDSDYALSGAFFSRSPKNIEKVSKQFNVGNLYINDKSTGALVNRQPFGGFKMSGTGIKAGGPDYLKNFVDAKLVSENTMRRGFTPEVSI